MLLALDTSTHLVGIALYDGVQVPGEVTWICRDYHSVELAPAVRQILSQAGLTTGDLKALVVARGPGSFTGLRIGIALAKGIALAHRLPLIGVSTFEALARAQPVDAEAMAVLLRAGRGRLAVGWHLPADGRWVFEGKTEILTALELAQRIHRPTRVSGELTAEERGLLSRKRRNVILATPAESLRKASYLAEAGWMRWQAGQVDDPATLAPIYLHLINQPIPG